MGMTWFHKVPLYPMYSWYPPRCTHDILPMYSWYSPDVLNIPNVLVVSPNMHHDIPRCTEHPPMYSWYPPDVLMVSPDVLNIPLCTHDIPICMISPTCIMISPDVLMVSPDVLNIPLCTHDIPICMISPTCIMISPDVLNPPDVLMISPRYTHGTPPIYSWYPPDVLMVSPDVLMVSPRCTEHPPIYWTHIIQNEKDIYRFSVTNNYIFGTYHKYSILFLIWIKKKNILKIAEKWDLMVTFCSWRHQNKGNVFYPKSNFLNQKQCKC